ncbi:MAG: hypothetical protein NXI20_17220 [bacterium]|nr:hypothetical protein [bacterium]
MIRFGIILTVIVCIGCQSNSGSVEQWKQEIYETELAFSRLSEKEGIEKAFLAYAAEDAVIKRKGKLVISRDSLKSYFKNSNPSTGTEVLTWEPDFVDVSNSGDLGYTYGKFIYSLTDSAGNVTENTGYFHTVWKRQKDGAWKFVWD